MSRRSNVFSLPPEVFEIIVKDLDIDDLCMLSTCSKRSFNLVKNSVHLFKTPECEKPFVLNVSFDSISSINLKHDQFSEIMWCFNGKRNPERYELGDNPQCSVKINCGQYNKKIIFSRTNFLTLHVYETAVENSIQELLQFAEHISTLFNAPVEELFIAPAATVHLEAIQSVPILKKCTEFAIDSDNIGTISHEAMRLAVEGFDCQKVKINCSFDRYFKLPLKYNCKYLYLLNSQVSNQHLNVFLHQWISHQSSCEEPVDIEIIAAEITKYDEEYGFYGDKCWREPEAATGREKHWDLREIAQGLSSYVINYSKDQERLVFQRETDGMQLKLQLFIFRWQKEVRLTGYH